LGAVPSGSFIKNLPALEEWPTSIREQKKEKERNMTVAARTVGARARRPETTLANKG